MKLINLILALVVSGLMALLVFEGGLRLIGMGPPKLLLDFDETTGWSNQAGREMAKATPDRGPVQFSINEYGLREDDDVTPQKPDGTKRVIVLGDSFTLGVSLEKQELFHERLKRHRRIQLEMLKR